MLMRARASRVTQPAVGVSPGKGIQQRAILMPLITAFHFNSRTTFPYYLLTNLAHKLLCIAIAGMNLSVEPPMEGPPRPVPLRQGTPN